MQRQAGVENLDLRGAGGHARQEEMTAAVGERFQAGRFQDDPGMFEKFAAVGAGDAGANGAYAKDPLLVAPPWREATRQAANDWRERSQLDDRFCDFTTPAPKRRSVFRKKEEGRLAGCWSRWGLWILKLLPEA